MLTAELCFPLKGVFLPRSHNAQKLAAAPATRHTVAMILRSVPLLVAIAVLSSCGAPKRPVEAPSPEARAPDAPTAWVLCDGINMPQIVTLTRHDDASAEMRTFSKQDGAQAIETMQIGATEGAAGSVYTELLHGADPAGHVRAINPGMLETPGAAYTQPVTSLQFGTQRIECRWLARTRLAGFTERRSFVITEDADGDLLYTTFDFADAANATPIDLADNSRSTTFSVEARGGTEELTPDGASFSFENNGYRYVVTVPRAGDARLDVLQNGEVLQSEPLIAWQLGLAE